MSRVLALLTTWLLVAGCSLVTFEQEPTAPPPQPTAEPTTVPAPPIDDLHVECAGDSDPTVVLVAGLDTRGTVFDDLRSRISGTARTCVYDRAGIGSSPSLGNRFADPSPGSAAADLRATLAAERIEPPYVVMGWSYGGLVAQAYAAEFPEEVVGLVLEDSSVREQFTDSELDDPLIDWVEGGRTIDEDALVEQLADLDLGDLPVAVLSLDGHQSWVRPWWRSHDRLARTSTEGVHAIAVGSGHAMHEDVPRLVARTVKAVWSAAAAGAGLPECRTLFRGERVRCRV